MSKKAVTGTREWAVHNVNWQLGCEHDCLYCYARYNACRFGRIRRPEDWTRPRIRTDAIESKRTKLVGRVMAPTTHDITPANLPASMAVLRKLLEAGNRVLIVSKPSLYVVQQLCEGLESFREQVEFRFSITATDYDVSRFWEPGAPSPGNRLAALRWAYAMRWATSVSCEPLLQPDRALELIEAVSPAVNGTIWIGKCNRLRQRTAHRLIGNHPMLQRLQAQQSDDGVREVYAALKDHPKMRWKESYKRVIGLPLAERAGLDI